jgi:hypothetical protein
VHGDEGIATDKLAAWTRRSLSFTNVLAFQSGQPYNAEGGMEFRDIEIKTMTAPIRIVEGRVYKYLSPPAKGQLDCRGQLYKVVFFVRDVPSYQEKVVVQGLTGPDKGQRFACSLYSFATRFEPAVEEIVTPTPVEPEPVTAGGWEASMLEGGPGW